MFDQSFLQLPTKEAKKAAVKARVQTALESGTFTYTDLMLNHEELVTLAFEAMDGVVVSGTLPNYGQGGIYRGGTVRLVSTDPTQPIKYSEFYEPLIAGTDQRGAPRKRTVELGQVADVDDSWEGQRIARRVLLQFGWPVRNVRSNGATTGHIVEWRWLEKAAARGDATQEITDLYNKLKPLVEPESAPKTKRMNAAQPAAGV